MGLTAYFAFLPVLMLVLYGVATLSRVLGFEPDPQEVLKIFLSEQRLGVLFWLLILVTLAGPIAEELFFRGLLYRLLRVRIGVTKGLVLTAFIFACLHGNWVALIPIFGLGLLFGWIYEKTGTLWVSIILHVLHNSWMIAIVLLLKRAM